MRNLFLAGIAAVAFAGQAFAADLPSMKSAPVYEAPMAISWTGFYTGDQVGLMAGQAKWQFPAVGYTVDTFGAFGGEHIGYRRQFDAWVLGLQGEANLVGASGVTNISATQSLSVRQDWLYSVDAQLGYAFADRWMGYVIGGAAFTSIVSDFVATQGQNTADVRFKTNKSGFDVGAGLEYAISEHWSAFAEYRFYDFGKSNYAAARVGNLDLLPLATHSLSLTDNTGRIGASYRFNFNSVAPAVVAKY